ncbi:MAG: hypothetical protein ACYS22_09475 [Planctomycetota bacterium]|jgi:hypothetical protein
MRFKRYRLGPQLARRAHDDGFFDQVHVVFGGTGAVGGATVLQLVRLFEEAARLAGRKPLGDDAATDQQTGPRIVITGRTRQEVRAFTRRFFKIQERDHGRKPTHVKGCGYRSAGGVLIELTTLPVDPAIPALRNFAQLAPEEREDRLTSFLVEGGLEPSSRLEEKLRWLGDAIREQTGRPFTDFLETYVKDRGLPGSATRLRSVVVGIPLASVAAYKLRDLEVCTETLGVEVGSRDLEDLKAAYLRSIRDDLAHANETLTDEVLVAHTTAVGGMYDEEDEHGRQIRLGFAHSALGDRLRQKQIFAETLTDLYAERGIKMLITAAAIGVDAILVRKSPPINGAVRGQLEAAARRGDNVVPSDNLSTIHVYEPVNLDLTPQDVAEIGDDRNTFEPEGALVCDYVVKSGENGFFSVSNADALYRVMRVTSSSELGLTLARVACFGDDPARPLFPNSVYYFTETDNSRQVFDLLNQPELFRTQTEGLSPKALMDLGSAKHQGELHTLGLLILLHRLKSLDLDAIHPRVDLTRFDPARFFEKHSHVLTLDHVLGWTPNHLARDLRTLVTAREPGDLSPLKSFFQADPKRQEAAHRVLSEVIRAVHQVTSLGTPIVYEDEGGKTRVLCGPYAAPLDIVVPRRGTLAHHIRRELARIHGDDAAKDPGRVARFWELHLASFGFADLRPVAVLSTARSSAEAGENAVRLFRGKLPFVAALDRLEPYTFFTSSGLIALLVRLIALQRAASGLALDLGSDNEWRAHLPRDADGRPLLIPGVVEAFRMVSEGLEKNTGFERLDGPWGYRTV